MPLSLPCRASGYLGSWEIRRQLDSFRLEQVVWRWEPAKNHSCSLLLLVVPWLHVVHTLAIVIAIIRIPLVRGFADCFIALLLVGNGRWFSALQFKS